MVRRIGGDASPFFVKIMDHASHDARLRDVIPIDLLHSFGAISAMPALDHRLGHKIRRIATHDWPGILPPNSPGTLQVLGALSGAPIAPMPFARERRPVISRATEVQLAARMGRPPREVHWDHAADPQCERPGSRLKPSAGLKTWPARQICRHDARSHDQPNSLELGDPVHEAVARRADEHEIAECASARRARR